MQLILLHWFSKEEKKKRNWFFWSGGVKSCTNAQQNLDDVMKKGEMSMRQKMSGIASNNGDMMK